MNGPINTTSCLIVSSCRRADVGIYVDGDNMVERGTIKIEMNDMEEEESTRTSPKAMITYFNQSNTTP